MKHTIKWHEENLENLRSSAARYYDEFVQAKARFEETTLYIAHYLRQIEEARRRGLDDFDRERFMKPREPK